MFVARLEYAGLEPGDGRPRTRSDLPVIGDGYDARRVHLGPFTGAQSSALAGISANGGSPAHAEQCEVAAVAWLRLDNRGELLATLDLPPRENLLSDEDLITEAYLRWGTGCAQRLEGDFSFALWDSRKRLLYAARDAVGVRPFYYAESAQAFGCAASPALLVDVLRLAPSVRVEWMARYLHLLSASVDSTALSGVQQLPPGCWLEVRDGHTRVERYHDFVDDSPWEVERDPTWLHAYRDAFTESVRNRIWTGSPIGAENSGGLDSSSIVAMLAKLAPESVPHLHTFGFAAERREPELIMRTSQDWSVSNNHISGTPPSEDTVNQRQAWRVLGQPVDVGVAASHVPVYLLAAQLGVRTLHSGHGGDETVTNEGTLVVREMLRRRAWRPLMRDLPGSPVLRPARVAKGWVTHRARPTSHLTNAMMTRLRLTPLRPEVVDVTRLRDLTLQAAGYDGPHHTVNEFILGDRLGPHLSTRTAQCSIVAAAFGVEYRWPLLDRRLIQQYLSSPSIWKYGEGFGRYLHRRAVTGIVPDSIAWKASKAMGGRILQSADTGLVDGVTSGALRELHPTLAPLVEPRRLERLILVANSSQDETLKLTVNRVQQLNAWLYDRET